jgi:hypothetical protein
MLNELYKNLVPETVCEKCLDTGVFRTIGFEVLDCPNIVMNFAHAKPNIASQLLKKSVQIMNDKGFVITGHAFELARVLTHYNNYDLLTYAKARHFLYHNTNLTHAEQKAKLDDVLDELIESWELSLWTNHIGIFIKTGEKANV